MTHKPPMPPTGPRPRPGEHAERSDASGSSPAFDYRTSGVDIDAAEAALDRIRGLVTATHGAGVVPIRDGFAGAYRVGPGRRILLASIDGVGTKIRLAVRAGRHRGLGHDIVHHGVNDVLVHGGRPIFFLDYVGTARLSEAWFHELLTGISEACRGVGCALLGGETAEMPGIYHGDDFDLVGAIVGEVPEEQLIDGSRVRPGDRLLGLPSSGLHTNGYTLARRIVAERAGDDLDAGVPGAGGASWADLLLAPHRCYLEPVLPLVEAKRVSALAHITGGGIGGNLVRVLPGGLCARVDARAWEPPPLFRALASLGQVRPAEMFRAFNMGIGFIVVVARESADAVAGDLIAAGEHPIAMGEIVAGERRVDLVGLPGA